jgi:shikimate kinase
MNVCGNSFSQTPIVNALRSGRGAHFNISVRVKMVKETDDESCEKKTRGFTKYYKALLVWNPSARRYVSTSRALNQLSRFNEKSF